MGVCVFNGKYSYRSHYGSGNDIISVHISQPGRPVCGKGTETANSAMHLSPLEVNQKFNQAGVKPSNRNHAKALCRL